MALAVPGLLCRLLSALLYLAGRSPPPVADGRIAALLSQPDTPCKSIGYTGGFDQLVGYAVIFLLTAGGLAALKIICPNCLIGIIGNTVFPLAASQKFSSSMRLAGTA